MKIGIDLGGTNIAGGLVTDTGQLVKTYSVKTEASKGYDEVLSRIAQVIKALEEEARLLGQRPTAVGIGVPGLADDYSGTVYECVNLLWREPKHLAQDVKALTGYTVHLGNDASVAAVAEFKIGALKGVRNGALITLGTGVGGGFIIQGHPFSGSHGVGSEIGHMVVAEGYERCNCGRMGCLETYASATALIKRAQQQFNQGQPSAYLRDQLATSDHWEAKWVIEGAKLGDDLCLEVFNEMVEKLSVGIINLVTFMDPEVIAIGGGVSKAGSFLLDALTSAIEKERIFRAAPKVVLKIAEAGNDAGIIGAAMLCE